MKLTTGTKLRHPTYNPITPGTEFVHVSNQFGALGPVPFAAGSSGGPETRRAATTMTMYTQYFCKKVFSATGGIGAPSGVNGGGARNPGNGGEQGVVTKTVVLCIK